jgi:WD40 repeat protein
MYSHSGELLLADTEEADTVEIFRTSGDPSTWDKVGEADHGGSPDQAVNSDDLTEDDQFIGTAGTNGKLWPLEVTRDGSGQITSASLNEIAEMTEPNDTGREARFDNKQGDHLASSVEADQAVRIYDVSELQDNSGAGPVQTLRNDGNVSQGNEVEPVAYTSDRRFMIADGSAGGVAPAFLRVYETAQIEPGAPEPDPIYVRAENVFSTEYLDFNGDDSKLISARDDGTVKLWNVSISGARTLGAEAFNELTSDHDRWSLSGSVATTNGDNDWGVTADGEGTVQQNDVDFLGHRGQRFLAADNLQGEIHTLALNEAFDLSGEFDAQRQIQSAAAAEEGAYESDDFLRLLADVDGDEMISSTRRSPSSRPTATVIWCWTDRAGGLTTCSTIFTSTCSRRRAT